MCDLYRVEEAESGVRHGMGELLDELVVAATNLRIYWADHPRVLSSLAALERILGAIFAEHAEDELLLGMAERCLFFERLPLAGATVSAPRVVRCLERLGAGGITFGRGARAFEFAALVKALAREGAEETSFQQANRLLEHDGCVRLRFLPSYSERGALTGERGDPLAALPARGERLASELVAPVQLYGNTVDLLQDAVVSACHGAALDLPGARDAVGAILGRLQDDAAAMRSIARYERYDAYTFGHSIRVCTLSLAFAQAILPPAERDLVLRVGMGGLLHDIGKAWVPFEVLHATGRLNPEERLEMNRHAEHGARILLSVASADPLVVACAFGHHRTHDGGGYPETAFRTEQSVGTRIVKICDVYEALTAVRPYKDRMPPLQAYRLMMSMKNHFDPRLLKRFIAFNGLYPVGTDLRLAGGGLVRVVEQGRELTRPIVRRLAEDGRFTPEPELELARERVVRVHAA